MTLHCREVAQGYIFHLDRTGVSYVCNFFSFVTMEFNNWHSQLAHTHSALPSYVANVVKGGSSGFLFMHKNQMLLYMAKIQVSKEVIFIDLQDLWGSLALLPSFPSDTLSQHPSLVSVNYYNKTTKLLGMIMVNST